jgi:hypothetical protein
MTKKLEKLHIKIHNIDTKICKLQHKKDKLMGIYRKEWFGILSPSLKE